MTSIPEAWAEHCTPAPQTSSREQWLRERRNGVGASDVSTIMGVNRYSSPYDLWEEKTGRQLIVESTSPQALWGQRMEPFIREDVAAETGRDIATYPTVISTKYPWLRYSPDGVFTDDGALLEIKTTGQHSAHEWAGGQVSDHAELQVQTGMIVTGAPYAIVVVVIDRGPIQYRRVERDDELAAAIIEQTRSFWDLVESDTPPPIDGSDATRNALIASYPTHDGPAVVDETGEALQLREQYQQAEDAEKRAKADKEQAANQLRALIGDAAEITTPDGAPIARITYGALDQKRFRAQHPELVEQFTTTRSVLDTTRVKTDRPDIYSVMRQTRITIPKGAN